MTPARAIGVASAGDALSAAVDALRAAGCDTPELDAQVLISDALGIDRAELIARPERTIESTVARLIADRIRRRIEREPVAYILGRRWFRDLYLRVDRYVLVPRPETELLVEVALGLGLPAGARVHDVGTGSGAVALAVKHARPDLSVSGSDRSTAALVLAYENATRLGLELDLHDGAGLPAEALEEGLPDLVVANLPYIREDEWSKLEPEIVRYEPRRALVAGPDGLEAIRALVEEAPAGLLLALEHAPAQAEAVRGLLADARTRRDLAGHERVTLGRVPQ